MTLTLTSDDLESDIVMNVSSTYNIMPTFIKIGRKRFFGKEEIQKSGPRDFRYFSLVGEAIGIFFDRLENGVIFGTLRLT